MNCLELPGPEHTEALGVALAQALVALQGGAAIAFHGELGAGKTTLARALIRALGHTGPVVSPTYTLVEPYVLDGRRLLHLDLYRIGEPEELEYLGWREWDTQTDWMLAEWPERGGGFLPAFDLHVTLAYLQHARQARLAAGSERGQRLLDLIQRHWNSRIQPPSKV